MVEAPPGAHHQRFPHVFNTFVCIFTETYRPLIAGRKSSVGEPQKLGPDGRTGQLRPAFRVPTLGFGRGAVGLGGLSDRDFSVSDVLK